MSDIQVAETMNEGLKREFSVSIPRAAIDSAVDAKLDEIGRSVHINGFRPGKIPPKSLLKQRFGASASSEVIEKSINDAVSEIVTERKLHPVAPPTVKDLQFADTKDLGFRVFLEIFPEIKVRDFSSLSCERTEVEVEDHLVEEKLAALAKHAGTLGDLPEARPSRMGDVVEMSFTCSIDGKDAKELATEDMSVELGSGEMLDSFEEQLVGVKGGDVKEVAIKFPETHRDQNMRGKTGVFSVKVKAVKVKVPHAIDEDLAKKYRMPSLEAMKKEMANDLKSEYSRVSESILKRRLFDQLCDSYDFQLPQTLVDGEFNSIWSGVQDMWKKNGMSSEDSGKSEEQLRKEYRQIAERRIRLSLIFGRIVEDNKIEVKRDELMDAIKDRAKRFGMDAESIAKHYFKREDMMRQLSMEILESKVVSFILTKAKVSEKKVKASELMEMAEAID